MALDSEYTANSSNTVRACTLISISGDGATQTKRPRIAKVGAGGGGLVLCLVWRCQEIHAYQGWTLKNRGGTCCVVQFVGWECERLGVERLD